MKTQQQELSDDAFVLYQRTWQGYEAVIRDGGTDTLSAYCKTAHVNYDRMIRWMSAKGLSVIRLKREVRKGGAGTCEVVREAMAGLFVQFTPSPSVSRLGRLRGVAISFPDGVGLTLQESTVEEVVALVDTYERRRSAREEAPCSR